MTSPQDPATPCPVSVTDSPQCGALCLGAITLPCGHLSCRRCCRHLLQQPGGIHLTCRSCEQHLPLPGGCSSVSQVLQQLGSDPVVQGLVQQRLMSQKHLCHIHKETAATTVCEDCQEYYCDGCSEMHRKLGMSTDHVLRLLATAGRDSSSSSYRTSTESARSTLSIANMSTYSAEPLLTIAESPDDNEARQWIQRVVPLLQRASNKKHTFVSSLKELAWVINQVVSTEAEQDELLQTYTDRLSRCHVVEQIGTHTFVITGDSDDFKTTMNIQCLEQRIINMINMCQSTSMTSSGRIRAMIQLHSNIFHNHEPQDSTTTSASEQTTSTINTSATTTITSSSYSSGPTTTTSLPSTHTLSASSTFSHTHTPHAVDVMTATPHKVFVSTSASADDTKKPFITSIVCAQDEKLVVTDPGNKNVKVVDMSDPYSVSASLTVEEKPRRLAVLSDGLVAVTTLEPTIYLLRVSPTLAVVSRIHTDRLYDGVAEGLSDHTLLVSCRKTGHGPAGVDVITRDGEVVRTVVDSTTLTELSDPHYLCVTGETVLMSDCEKHTVYKVDMTTGQLVDTLTRSDMKSPFQVSADGEGNIYIASEGGQCVLVRSAQNEWRRIVYPPDHTDQGCDRPWGVSATRSGRLVVAWCKHGSGSVLTGYDLKG